MMLRSSSTPLFGSLLSSCPESPSNHHHQSDPKPPSIHQSCGKLACTNGGSQNITRSLLNSPSLPEIKGISGSAHNGFRRVQSEGNLEELATASYNLDEFSFSRYSNKFTRKPTGFSPHYLGTPFEDDGSDEEAEDEEEEEEIQVKEVVNACTAENFVSEEIKMKLNAYSSSSSSMGFEGEGKMYLATGLGFPRVAFVDDGGHGSGSGSGDGRGGNYRPDDSNRDGGESRGLSMEEHYKSMLQENPGNPLFLRNYAQFLYQERGDLEGAEKYYCRAILADPGDGEILCQYAKLIWDLHHDKDRAAAYFDRAVQASLEDSHIHAAYASFLWDTEDEEYEDDDEENAVANSHPLQPLFHHGVTASTTA